MHDEIEGYTHGEASIPLDAYASESQANRHAVRKRRLRCRSRHYELPVERQPDVATSHRDPAAATLAQKRSGGVRTGTAAYAGTHLHLTGDLGGCAIRDPYQTRFGADAVSVPCAVQCPCGWALQPGEASRHPDA
jgi:hypothetical protein